MVAGIPESVDDKDRTVRSHNSCQLVRHRTREFPGPHKPAHEAICLMTLVRISATKTIDNPCLLTSPWSQSPLAVWVAAAREIAKAVDREAWWRASVSVHWTSERARLSD